MDELNIFFYQPVHSFASHCTRTTIKYAKYNSKYHKNWCDENKSAMSVISGYWAYCNFR